ncbi:quinolinate synthetase [Fictibacillus macauensis ZFHKF-1]|uniref:Quinolinate synthase n=1 Tax=Fictibacillus macauensis ZFHKF-1 TaxID=1196324 RepID=I8AIM4_9BACL|nr:quinolinate synthase NadA [Fictibacillus macauensis]EIT85324.1 quinolinate synthetase [Fictibacillus macauensis ZFHKF-1]
MSILEAFKQQSLLPESYYAMSEDELKKRVQAVKEKMGKRLFIPGHHYQKDEVIQFADTTGDSLQLAQQSALNQEAEFIVFCGVHFMAETADMLTTKDQTVILPDLRAGCSMADMATIHQTERSWEKLQALFGDTILPLTYVNSTAAIKAFCGKYGGATVTSSNARKMLEWAFTQKERMLFLPDQHLGRNTAYDLGVALEEMAVWNPDTEQLEYEGDVEKIKVILWKGHCSVHEKFTVENIAALRESDPAMKIIVHPECSHEVVQKADYNGSTHYIIQMIEKAASGTKWAIGTEMNLVNRLRKNHPDQEIISLNPNMCPCLTMNRIDLPHLAYALEQLEQNPTYHKITVNEETTHYAVKALQRMLERV